MGFDIGNAGSWSHGMTRPVRPVTDLTPHVDGGPASARGSNAVANPDDRGTLHDAAALVIAALVLLWIAGAFTFRNHNL